MYPLVAGASFAPPFQTSTYRATTSGSADSPIWAEPVELSFVQSRGELSPRHALCLKVTTEGAKRRDSLIGQARATERNGGEQDEAVDLFGVIGGD